MQNNISHYNNFDLIRLFAASQVFLHHMYEIVGVDYGAIVNGLSYFLVLFPGVPIFFFISGYLISQSFERSSSLKSYSLKRILRIYPALIISVVMGVLLILASGYEPDRSVGFFDWCALVVTKITIFQFYNQEFLRDYGDGVFNGNLWTITVELQFYVMIALFYTFFRKMNLSKAWYWGSILLLAILANRVFAYLHEDYSEEIWFKLYRVSFFPWIYMFVLGVIAQIYKNQLIPFVRKYALLILLAYGSIAFAGLWFEWFEYGNNISPLLVPGLFLSVLACAYCFPGMSKHVVRGQDVSYGIYLYHMLIINFFLFLSHGEAEKYSLLIIVLVVLVSIMSWFFLEKPSLTLKKHFL